MFLAGMKVHEKSDRSDIPCSSEGVDQIVFFLPPAAFYAWAAQSLMTCEPSAARLLHRLGAVPLNNTFKPAIFVHVRAGGHIRRAARCGDDKFTEATAGYFQSAVDGAEHLRCNARPNSGGTCRSVGRQHRGFLSIQDT